MGAVAVQLVEIGGAVRAGQARARAHPAAQVVQRAQRPAHRAEGARPHRYDLAPDDDEGPLAGDEARQVVARAHLGPQPAAPQLLDREAGERPVVGGRGPQAPAREDVAVLGAEAHGSLGQRPPAVVAARRLPCDQVLEELGPHLAVRFVLGVPVVHERGGPAERREGARPRPVLGLSTHRVALHLDVHAPRVRAQEAAGDPVAVVVEAVARPGVPPPAHVRGSGGDAEGARVRVGELSHGRADVARGAAAHLGADGVRADAGRGVAAHRGAPVHRIHHHGDGAVRMLGAGGGHLLAHHVHHAAQRAAPVQERHRPAHHLHAARGHRLDRHRVVARGAG